METRLGSRAISRQASPQVGRGAGTGVARRGRLGRLLGVWAVVAGVAEVGLVVTFMAFLFPASQGSNLPDDFSELVAALHAPAVFRLAIGFDILIWLMLGAFLVTLAAWLAPQASTRRALLALCGIGQVVGVAGAVMRMQGIPGLAVQYASASTAQQVALQHAFLDLQKVIGALFDAGAMLWGAGLFLAVSIVWATRDIPRWLTVGLALAGVLEFANGLFHIPTGQMLGPAFYVATLVEIVVFFGLAWRLLRRSRTAASIATA